MISITHLIWILPLTTFIAILFTAFIAGASTNNKYQEIYNEGVNYGYDLAKCYYETKEELNQETRDDSNI